MECLSNRIGLLGCGAPSTEASEDVPALPILFINDLPGVTIEKIDSLADDERETYLEIWKKIVIRTMKKFEILVKAKLNQCYKLTDKTVVACLVCEKKELFDVALWYLHGTELMIEITSTDAINRFTTIDLEKAERLKEEFYNEFLSALNDAVTGINPQDSDCITKCVECNDTYKWALQIP